MTTESSPHLRWVSIAAVALASCASSSGTQSVATDAPTDPTPTTLLSTAPDSLPSVATTASTPVPETRPAPVSSARPSECTFRSGVITRTHAANERRVLVEPAESASASEPAPALVLLHGFAGQARKFAANTGLLDEASGERVSLVVPFGIGEPPTWELATGPFDDAGFLAELVDDIASDPCIDPERIWLAGYSAGAGFAGLRACALQEHLAGIVMNAAAAPVLCEGLTGIDVVIAHGTADRVVPYEGLTIDAESGATLPGSPELAAGWAASLACDTTSAGAETDEFDQQRWTECSDDTSTVDMLSYIGGGHRWPGRPGVGGEGVVVESPDLTCVIFEAIAGADDPVSNCGD